MASSIVVVRNTSGDAFPTSPGIGDRHWRTDLHRERYWDGTRWLSVQEFDAGGGWTYYNGATVAAYLATAQEYMFRALRSDYAWYLTRLQWFGLVNTTNNRTNYWRPTLRTFTGLVTVANPTTVSWGAGAWTPGTVVTSFAAQPSTSDMGLEWYVDKVGSPGSFSWTWSLFYRLVLL